MKPYPRYALVCVFRTRHELRHQDEDKVQTISTNEPLHRYTSLRIGPKRSRNKDSKNASQSRLNHSTRKIGKTSVITTMFTHPDKGMSPNTLLIPFALPIYHHLCSHNRYPLIKFCIKTKLYLTLNQYPNAPSTGMHSASGRPPLVAAGATSELDAALVVVLWADVADDVVAELVAGVLVVLGEVLEQLLLLLLHNRLAVIFDALIQIGILHELKLRHSWVHLAIHYNR